MLARQHQPGRAFPGDHHRMSLHQFATSIRRVLGHRDVTTTMNVYAGLFPNRLDEIATALDGLYQAAQSVG